MKLRSMIYSLGPTLSSDANSCREANLDPKATFYFDFLRNLESTAMEIRENKSIYDESREGKS